MRSAERIFGRRMAACFILAIVLIAVPGSVRPEEVLEAESASEWKRVFTDDFGREELGDVWKPLSGRWEISEGRLFGRGEIIIDRRFRGCQRVVFKAVSERDPNDLSVFLHSSDEGIRSGYFLQFGGFYNMLSTLRRKDMWLARDNTHLIEEGKTHTIIGEFDGERLRLEVDGNTVFEYEEKEPLLGDAHERIGFYIFTPSYIEEVSVYLKAAE